MTRDNSVFAFLRYGSEGKRPVLVVSNMTPVPRPGYAIGVPRPGRWRELLNSDAAIYGGSNMGNGGCVTCVPEQRHGEAQVAGTDAAAIGDAVSGARGGLTGLPGSDPRFPAGFPRSRGCSSPRVALRCRPAECR